MNISLCAVFTLLIDNNIQFTVMPCSGYAVPCLRMWDQNSVSADYMCYDIQGMCVLRDSKGAMLISDKWLNMLNKVKKECLLRQQVA